MKYKLDIDERILEVATFNLHIVNIIFPSVVITIFIDFICLLFISIVIPTFSSYAEAFILIFISILTLFLYSTYYSLKKQELVLTNKKILVTVNCSSGFKKVIIDFRQISKINLTNGVYGKEFQIIVGNNSIKVYGLKNYKEIIRQLNKY